jgi:alpha-amylase/alpha-mannosidase (GH57 family)
LITPDVYEPISQEKAAQILREWVDPLWDVPTELKEDLQLEVLDHLAAADGIYYLAELGDEAIHNWGRVHDYFHEFVLIDRSAG